MLSIDRYTQIPAPIPIPILVHREENLDYPDDDQWHQIAAAAGDAAVDDGDYFAAECWTDLDHDILDMYHDRIPVATSSCLDKLEFDL